MNEIIQWCAQCGDYRAYTHPGEVPDAMQRQAAAITDAGIGYVPPVCGSFVDPCPGCLTTDADHDDGCPNRPKVSLREVLGWH